MHRALLPLALALLGLAATLPSAHGDASVTGGDFVTNAVLRPLSTFEKTLTITSAATLPTVDPNLVFSNSDHTVTCVLDVSVAGIGTAAAATITIQPFNPDAHATIKSCDKSYIPEGTYDISIVHAATDPAQYTGILATGVEIRDDGMKCSATAAAGEAATYCEGAEEDHDEESWMIAAIVAYSIIGVALLSGVYKMMPGGGGFNRIRMNNVQG